MTFWTQSTRQGGMPTWVRRFSWSLLLVGTVGVWSSGCATRQEPQISLRTADYRKLLDQRQTSKPVDAALRQELPAMTAGDYEARGDTYLNQGNLPMAMVQYDKALRVEPGSARLHYKAGLLLWQQDLVDEASQEWQTALQQDAQYALAHAGMGQVWLKKGNLAEAENSVRQAIALDPTRWQSYNLLGLVYDRRQQFDDAIAVYQSAMLLHPEQGVLFNNLGLSYYQKGDYESAVQHFQQALQQGYAQERVSNNLGLALAKLGHYDEALEAFTQGGDKARAYNNLGVVCAADGKYPAALAFLQKAAALHPSYYARAHANLQAVHKAMGAPAVHQKQAVPTVR